MGWCLQRLEMHEGNFMPLGAGEYTTMTVDEGTRSYWRWSKQDFFPETSFKSLASYKSALSKTYPRLKNRLLARTTETSELALQQESERPLQKCLTWWDLIWLSFSSVVGSGILYIRDHWSTSSLGRTFNCTSLCSFRRFCIVICVLLYRVRGGDSCGWWLFSYLRVELGDFIAYIAAVLLDVLSSVFSVSTLLIFMLIAVALLVRRYYVKDVTPKNDLVKFLVCLFIIIGSSIGLTIIWNTSVRGWYWYVTAAVPWLLGTLGMELLPKQRAPTVWGVPLVPWLPSASIALNLFLVGSLGYVAFLRFIICTAVMLVYYLLVGVHGTYDVAQQNQEQSKLEEGVRNMNQGMPK